MVDKLSVATDIGECCIELCVGDVTKLQREQAVDVLVVSAFSGINNGLHIPMIVKCNLNILSLATKF